MSKASRDKGAQFERDVQDLARAHGFTTARRAFASGAQGGPDLTGIPGVAIECKRQERVNLPAWWRQAVAVGSVLAVVTPDGRADGERGMGVAFADGGDGADDGGAEGARAEAGAAVDIDANFDRKKISFSISN